MGNSNKDSLKDYTKKEYEHIWAVIETREQAVRQLFSASVIVSISILSAVAGYTLGMVERDKLSVEMAYLFLAPVLISIPMFMLQAGHRHELFRAGNYIRVFYDKENTGTAYSTRLNRFRTIMPGESLDQTPLMYWVLFGICSVGFGYTLYKSGTFSFCYLPPLLSFCHLLPLLVLAWFVRIAHRRISFRCGKKGEEILKVWMTLRKEEPRSSNNEP